MNKKIDQIFIPISFHIDFHQDFPAKKNIIYTNWIFFFNPEILIKTQGSKAEWIKKYICPFSNWGIELNLVPCCSTENLKLNGSRGKVFVFSISNRKILYRERKRTSYISSLSLLSPTFFALATIYFLFAFDIFWGEIC